MRLRRWVEVAGLVAGLAASGLGLGTAQVKRPGSIVVEPSPAPPVRNPPKSWVDRDTGHRVFRLTDEPNSGAPYFNINAYTPDGKEMVYTSPRGIHLLTLATRASRLLVPAPAHFIVVGHKTATVFFTRSDPAARTATLYAADAATGEIRKLITLPERRRLQH